MCPFYTDHGVEYTEHDKPAAWCRFPSPARDRGTEQSSGRAQKAISYRGTEVQKDVAVRHRILQPQLSPESGCIN